MSDEKPIPRIRIFDEKDCKDNRTDDGDGRVLINTHTVEEDGHILTVYPASNLTLGSMRDETDPKYYIPTLRADAAFMPLSLVFTLTAGDLRLLGQDMIETAERMEAEAAAMLNDTLNRKGG
jgi:hypothetical protein